MSRLAFEDIKNDKWYTIPGLYGTDTPSRIYKTTYNGNNYIKSIATTNQQEIVQVPANEMIFAEPDENDIDELDDMSDKYDDDDNYIENLEDNQLFNFRAFDDPDELDLTPEQKLELYNIFVRIEKDTQKGGRRRTCKKRRSYKKRRTCKKRRTSKKRRSYKKY
jgi:hypothetical protein